MIPFGRKVSPKRKAKTVAEAVHAVRKPQPAPAELCPSEIYSPKCAEIARIMRSRGHTETELCETLGISPETLAVWQPRPPNLPKRVSQMKRRG